MGTLRRGWPGWTWDGSGDSAPFADAASAVTAAAVTSGLDARASATDAAAPAALDAVTDAGVVHPVPPSNITEVQLDSYSYAPTTVYGSNIVAAWQYSTGLGTRVAVIDDGFDPATTQTYGDFSTSLSRNFAGLRPNNLAEPAGGYHGTTTSGLIGDSGANGLPVGVAPNATVIGAKVGFGNGPWSQFVQALQYASQVGEVVNNSWAFTGYGVGEPTDPYFAGWYSALRTAVQTDRGGLGDVVVFAGGNDRADANTVALQPINSDPEVIAVAASDANGQVASYSNPGPGLLVAAIGDAVAVPLPGGSSYGFGYGTSYAAPTVSAIVSLMLSANPNLGWRDVQEILADSAYAPPPSYGSFYMNDGTGWNGGAMHFSVDLGFGVVDANVAVNLARAWTEQSTSANLVTATDTEASGFSIGPGVIAISSVNVSQNVRIQHVQITINDTSLPAAGTEMALVSPDGTFSLLLVDPGNVSGTDLTGGLDLSGSVITDNQFWSENSVGTWTLLVANDDGTTSAISNWSLTFWGDDAATVQTPLVYTPEFAALAAMGVSPTVVSTTGTNASTIDLIALPNTTSVDLNGGAGMIDGVAVTVQPGLTNANADGSTGSVTLVGLATGGSTLTGGDGPTSIAGYGHDTINTGLGATTITTGVGGSLVTLSGLAAATTQDSISSGGGDTIWAGSATVSITATGGTGDTVFAQAATLTFINGSGASTVYAGSGTALIQAGVGGGVYYAGDGGNSQLTAGSGKVAFYGRAGGDVLTAAGAANDILIAGAGHETLLGGSNTGSVTMIGGSGADIMTAGLGHTDFTVGTGNDTITTGGLSDIISILRGHAGGLDVVNNFRVGTDKLSLSGFAGNAPSNAIAMQTSDGRGGSLLFLPDGTRIDLVGITHATSAVFA